MKTRQENRERMFAIISEYRAGTETQQAFCGRMDIKLPYFRYWLNKFKEAEEHPSGFVQLTAPPEALAEGMELRYPNGVAVRLGQRTDMSLVAQLIRLW